MESLGTDSPVVEIASAQEDMKKAMGAVGATRDIRDVARDPKVHELGVKLSRSFLKILSDEVDKLEKDFQDNASKGMTMDQFAHHMLKIYTRFQRLIRRDFNLGLRALVARDQNLAFYQMLYLDMFDAIYRGMDSVNVVRMRLTTLGEGGDQIFPPDDVKENAKVFTQLRKLLSAIERNIDQIESGEFLKGLTESAASGPN